MALHWALHSVGAPPPGPCSGVGRSTGLVARWKRTQFPLGAQRLRICPPRTGPKESNDCENGDSMIPRVGPCHPRMMVTAAKLQTRTQALHPPGLHFLRCPQPGQVPSLRESAGPDGLWGETLGPAPQSRRHCLGPTPSPWLLSGTPRGLPLRKTSPTSRGRDLPALQVRPSFLGFSAPESFSSLQPGPSTSAKLALCFKKRGKLPAASPLRLPAQDGTQCGGGGVAVPGCAGVSAFLCPEASSVITRPSSQSPGLVGGDQMRWSLCLVDDRSYKNQSSYIHAEEDICFYF